MADTLPKKYNTMSGAASQAETEIAEGQQLQELSAEEDKRLLRRVDILLPIMALSYLFQFIDKMALSYTSILKLKEGLNLTGNQYSWSSSIYYFGYLVASYPAGVLMVHYPVGKVITSSVLIWGIILMLTSVCYNANGLLAVRFFLGFAESPIAPGLSIIISMRYKRSEQPLRHGAWFLGNTGAAIVGGLIAYGIGHIHSIEPWKAVFLIFGACTVLWSFVIYFLLPDVPGNAIFLKEADRVKTIQRVSANMTGVKNDTFKISQCIEALLDSKTWLIVLIQLSGQIANGGINGFSAIIINGMGFDTLTTLLYGILHYVFQLIFVLISAGGSSYFKQSRTYFLVWNFLFSVAGAAMVRQVSNEHVWTRFFGFCLTLAYSANFPIVISLVSGNFAGFTKKITVMAMIFIAYCAGNIVGPQLFFEDEAPIYTSAFLSMLICYGTGILASVGLRLYLIYENKRRDRRHGTTPESEIPNLAFERNFSDLTDKEITEFRYMY